MDSAAPRGEQEALVSSLRTRTRRTSTTPRTERPQPAGQVLDFIEKHGTLSSEAQTANHRAFTNLERLRRNTDTRNFFFESRCRHQDQRVIALKDRDWITRVWSAVVEDLKTGRNELAISAELEIRRSTSEVC